MSEPYEQVTSRVAALIGAHELAPGEADALLRLAKVVADASGDRRSAPLTCYLAGQALAGEADGAARVAQIEELATRLAD
jgi:hypothetical protein